MPTKRSTATKAAPGITARETAQRVAQARPLNDTQELIIDAVSDMLTHGGHEDDVNALIIGAMTHLEHRRVDRLFQNDPEGREKLVQSNITAGRAGWQTDLAIAWRANKRKEFPESDAKTISEQIRASQRELLNDRFGDFLRDATPEETRLLADILGSRESGVFDKKEGVDEIPLGDAFGWALGQDETYIRIPRGFREKTQRYIDALQAIEEKAA